MSQFFFTPISFQAAQNRYRDRLEEMDRILFPHGNPSLLDEHMSPEKADKALEDALESRLHHGSVSGNLAFFAKIFSDGKLDLTGKTVKEMILSIAENRDLLEQGIRNHFSDGAITAAMAVLAAGGAGFLFGRLSASPAKAAVPASAKVLKTALSYPIMPVAAFLAANPESAEDPHESRLLMILGCVGCVLAIAAILGLLGSAQRKRQKSADRMIEAGMCDQEQAREILKLAECLADIYRDERG